MPRFSGCVQVVHSLYIYLAVYYNAITKKSSAIYAPVSFIMKFMHIIIIMCYCML